MFFALLVFTVVSLLLLSVRTATRRALITSQAGSRWLVWITAGLLGWLGITGALGFSGLLAEWDAIPPRVLMLPVTYLAVLVSLSFNHSFQRLLVALPLWPFVAIAAWPLVWLPAFLAPTALYLHLLSIRQSLQPRVLVRSR